jgi:hypothetical protein
VEVDPCSLTSHHPGREKGLAPLTDDVSEKRSGGSSGRHGHVPPPVRLVLGSVTCGYHDVHTSLGHHLHDGARRAHFLPVNFSSSSSPIEI